MQSFDANMADEDSLHNKISMLQAEMLKFHGEISPVKSQEAERAISSPDEGSELLSTCSNVAFGLLKIGSYTVLPAAIFPAIVYYIEGSSPFFWQVTTVSCILISLLYVISTVCIFSEIVRDHATFSYTAVKETFKSLLEKIFVNNGLVHSLGPILTSEFFKMNFPKVLYPVILIFIGSLISYVTYVNSIWIAFYASLVSIGFICGILTTTICDLLSNPESLPFHSPYKIRTELATPTHVKRELVFSLSEGQESIRTPQLLKPDTALVAGNLSCTRPTTATVLPNYSPSINHKEAASSKIYQLPINFGKYFRGLQS